MAAPHPADRVSFSINRVVIGAIVAGGVALTAFGIAFIASGETSPGSVCSVLFGLFAMTVPAPKLRPGPVLVCDRSGLEAVRLSLRLRWEEIERMRLTKQATSYGQSTTYLDLWPVDMEKAMAQVRRKFRPFAGAFRFGGAGAIRVTIFLWSAAPSTVADEIERLSGRPVER